MVSSGSRRRKNSTKQDSATSPIEEGNAVPVDDTPEDNSVEEAEEVVTEAPEDKSAVEPTAEAPVTEPNTEDGKPATVEESKKPGRWDWNPNQLARLSMASSGFFVAVMVFLTGGLVLKWFAFTTEAARAADLLLLVKFTVILAIPYLVCNALAGILWAVAKRRKEDALMVSRSFSLFLLSFLGFPAMMFFFGVVRLFQAYFSGAGQ